MTPQEKIDRLAAAGRVCFKCSVAMMYREDRQLWSCPHCGRVHRLSAREKAKAENQKKWVAAHPQTNFGDDAAFLRGGS